MPTCLAASGLFLTMNTVPAFSVLRTASKYMGSAENVLSKWFKAVGCHNGVFSEAGYLKVTATTSCVRTQFWCKMIRPLQKKAKICPLNRWAYHMKIKREKKGLCPEHKNHPSAHPFFCTHFGSWGTNSRHRAHDLIRPQTTNQTIAHRHLIKAYLSRMK